MTATRVLFVASNATHVRMFAPVIAELRRPDVATHLIGFDDYYGQGATAAAEQLGLEIESVQRPGGPLSAAFYGRPVPLVWRDALSARRPLRASFDVVRPTVVVVGNDHGLLEKLALTDARRRGCRAVLLQDGRLAPRADPGSLRGNVLRAAKLALSPVLRALGLSFLAASDYGSGGADVICASGPEGAAILHHRSRNSSRVVITGQPRYDVLAHVERSVELRWDVVMFTTPFLAAGLGDSPQARQLMVAEALHAWAASSGRRFAVKPHPREDDADYAERIGRDGVLSGEASRLVADARAAVVGISTLLEEAALLGCPVLVPGRVIHGDRFDAVLPPPEIYPRADEVETLIAWLDRLSDPTVRADLLERQGAHVRQQIHWDAEVPAAVQVAEAILRA